MLMRIYLNCAWRNSDMWTWKNFNCVIARKSVLKGLSAHQRNYKGTAGGNFKGRLPFSQTQPLPLNNAREVVNFIHCTVKVISFRQLLSTSPSLKHLSKTVNTIIPRIITEDDHVRSSGILLQLRIYWRRRLEPGQGKEDHRHRGLGKDPQQQRTL